MTETVPVDAHNAAAGTKEREIVRLSETHFFGELALVERAPRVANVIAKGDVTCVYLTQEAFNRILETARELKTAVQERHAVRRKREELREADKLEAGVRSHRAPTVCEPAAADARCC